MIHLMNNWNHKVYLKTEDREPKSMERTERSYKHKKTSNNRGFLFIKSKRRQRKSIIKSRAAKSSQKSELPKLNKTQEVHFLKKKGKVYHTKDFKLFKNNKIGSKKRGKDLRLMQLNKIIRGTTKNNSCINERGDKSIEINDSSFFNKKSSVFIPKKKFDDLLSISNVQKKIDNSHKVINYLI